ncbi:MAG: hypothetical protein WBE86_08600 [Candidatus Acidiferrales bacterium]
MGILIKSGVLLLLSVLTVSSALFGQTDGNAPAKPQNPTSALDARHIVELSVAATERNWDAREDYAYTERDQDRRLDALGQVRSETVDVSRTIVVNGAHFDQLVEHNGHPPSAEEQSRSREDLDKLEHETPAERTVGKQGETGSFLQDIVNAFDFQLIGEESVEGRPAYVFRVTPHRGYHAHGKYGKMLSKVEGKVWVDKQDFSWIKVDGQVTQAFSMGLFVARVQRGSHVMLEQTQVSEGVWMPKRIEVGATAKILFFKSLDIDRILTYSDYCLGSGAPYSVSK